MAEEIKMYRILQTFNKGKLKNIPEMIAQEFQAIHLDQKIKPDMKIGITVGSRGIDNLRFIIKTVIEEVKKRKGRPPKTGKEIQIPAKRVPKFSAGKALKDSVA